MIGKCLGRLLISLGIGPAVVVIKRSTRGYINKQFIKEDVVYLLANYEVSLFQMYMEYNTVTLS